MPKSVIACGSNIPPRRKYIQSAIAKIGSLDTTKVLQRARIYETEPVGGPPQGLFLNSAIEIKTDLTPEKLLLKLLEIENSLKRRRIEKNGPRTIDLDIIFYENLILEDKDLGIPHPRFRERGFVLLPLYDIIPGFVDPLSNKTVRDTLEDWIKSGGKPGKVIEQ